MSRFTVGLLLVFFCVGYGITLNALGDQEQREVVSRYIKQVNQYLCAHGTNLPKARCEPIPLIKPSESDQPLANQFASLPNLRSAVEKLQWLNGSEVEAVKILSILKSLQISRSGEAKENRKATDLTVKLLASVWREYPLLVAGHSCMYCGNSFEMIEDVTEHESTSSRVLLQLSMGHPRWLSNFYNAENPVESLSDIVYWHGFFSNPGDGPSAELLGKLMHQSNAHTALEQWVQKGLNGSRSLDLLNLNSLPRNVVIKAWERGVSIGYDNIELTEFLLRHGHRPALRWLVWLQGAELGYLQNWLYNNEKLRYKKLVESYTDFEYPEGPLLAGHYSRNWRDVKFDADEQKWRLTPSN